MREIEFYQSGICDKCTNWKPTITFHAWETGHNGYDVEFEFCKDCLDQMFEQGKEEK